MHNLDHYYSEVVEFMGKFCIGKSAIVASRMAASLSSTGTPAHFVHATEWAHGDLGEYACPSVFDFDKSLCLNSNDRTSRSYVTLVTPLPGFCLTPAIGA